MLGVLCIAGQHCWEYTDGMLKAEYVGRKVQVQICSQPILDDENVM